MIYRMLNDIFDILFFLIINLEKKILIYIINIYFRNSLFYQTNLLLNRNHNFKKTDIHIELIYKLIVLALF